MIIGQIKKSIQQFQKNTFFKKIVFLYFGLLLLIILSTFYQYGISWDENIQQMYGKSIIKYYKSGFKKMDFLNIPTINGYGGLFDSIIAIFNQIIPFYPMEVRHLINALTGFIGMIGVYKLAHFFGGIRTGLIAAILIGVTPTYYGHIFMNPKDIPFAASYIWSIYFLILTVHTYPNPPKRLTTLLGIAFGITMAIRIGGLLLFGYLGIVIGLYSLILLVRKKYGFVQLLKTGTLLSLKILAISYFIILLFWPWAQMNPLVRPFQALHLAGNFVREGEEIFKGKIIYASTTESFPSDYLYTYFLINLPEITIISIVFGSIFVLYKILKLIRQNRIQSGLSYFLLVFSIWFPLIYLYISKSPIYNGNRHFLFVVPSMTVLSAYLLYKIFKIIQRFHLQSAKVFIGLLLVYAIFQIYTMFQLHPYQYIYYNQFAGGFKQASKNFEMDYWVTSNREMMKQLDNYIKREKLKPDEKGYFGLLFCADPLTIEYYLPPRFVMVTDKLKADFLVVNATPICKEYYSDLMKDESYPSILQVERMGVVLSYIKKLKK